MNKKGFTLVELLAVIVVLGLVITITATKGFGAFDNTKKAITEQNKKAIKEAANVLATQIDNCDDDVDSELWTGASDLTDKNSITDKNCSGLKKKISKEEGCITATVGYLINNGYLSDNKDFDNLKDNNVIICKDNNEIEIDTSDIDTVIVTSTKTTEKNNDKDISCSGNWTINSVNNKNEIPYCSDITGTNYVLVNGNKDPINYQEFIDLESYYNNLLTPALENENEYNGCTEDTCYYSDNAYIVFSEVDYNNMKNKFDTNIINKINRSNYNDGNTSMKYYYIEWLNTYINKCTETKYNLNIKSNNNYYGISNEDIRNNFQNSLLSTTGVIIFNISRGNYNSMKGFSYTCKMDFNKEIAGDNNYDFSCNDPVSRCYYNIPN